MSKSCLAPSTKRGNRKKAPSMTKLALTGHCIYHRLYLAYSNLQNTLRMNLPIHNTVTVVRTV